MTGEELFAKYGADILGAWEDQEPEVRQAWEDIAVGVTDELAKAAEQILGKPPF